MIFFSHRTRRALRDRLQQLPLGLSHYSYGHVCQRFMKVLSLLELSHAELTMPEIYSSYADIVVESGPTNNRRPSHIIFKAFEEIRVLKGAYNIAHVAWEYDRLPRFSRLPKQHRLRTNPLNDYVHALSLVDEVWVGCEFTKSVFVQEGLRNVHVIPAPVTLGQDRGTSSFSISELNIEIVEGTKEATHGAVIGGQATFPLESIFMTAADCRARGGRVFLSILNPHDPRKNSGALIAGFQKYVHRTNRNDLLIVKVLVDGKYNSLQDVFKVILPRRFSEAGLRFDAVDCTNILFLRASMSEYDMARLYRAADYYLCSSNAEGQNLPLLEAMMHGVVPISSMNTAMADYVSDETGFVLRGNVGPVYDSVASVYGIFGSEWSETSATDVAFGLRLTDALSGDDLKRKQYAARSNVERRYSLEAVASLVQARLRDICGDTGKVASAKI